MTDKINMVLKGKGLKLIVVLGILGMALILFSDTLFKKEESSLEVLDKPLITEYSSYIKEMENRLKETIEKINGVGNADIMITAVGSGEYVYVKDEKTRTDSESISREETYVIIGNSGQKEPVIQSVANPEIMGVVVVCEGGENNVVKEKVYNAVSAACGIPTCRIFVAGA